MDIKYLSFAKCFAGAANGGGDWGNELENTETSKP